MLILRVVVSAAVSLSFSICIATAQTQPSPERVTAIQEKTANLNHQAIGKLPPQLRNALSGGALNYLHFATAWENIKRSFGEGPDAQSNLAQIQAALEKSRNAPGLASTGPIPVSDPGADFLFSLESGFTQSETSSAWCGGGVVVGFNDSGSVFESLVFGPGGSSFAGAGASTDRGATFRDIGYINPGPNSNNSLLGDPVVNCADATTFYYSQIGLGGTVTAPTSDVFLSKSDDGGFTWENPTAAVSKDAITHFLDKDWSAIDHKHPKHLYASYTDFDLSGTMCGTSNGVPIERVAIEVVSSTDSGATWSGPTVVDQVCSAAPNFPFVQGSQISVDSHGNVYVAWEKFPSGIAAEFRQLRIARSTDHAKSFGPSSQISTVYATGDGFALQGNFRTWLTGSLAVDTSGTKSDGTLYMTWEDGRFRSRVDLESPFGLYRNANVVLSRSRDGGKTWSSPVRVNNDPLESADGVGIDHFQPGVAVDSTGAAAVCWYDRRNDPLNYQLTRYCAVSNSRLDVRVDPTIWPPIHAVDALINPNYLGDYDTVTSDQTNASAGFQGAYGNVSVRALVPNQDVFLVHLNE